jgi:hypothetical protein
MMRLTKPAPSREPAELTQAENLPAGHAASTAQGAPGAAGPPTRSDFARKQPYTKDVLPCFASFRKGSQTYIGKTHLIFQNGMPFAVLKWEEVPGGQAPAVLVPLDREWLQGPEARFQDHSYCYRHTIDWLDAQSGP